MRLILSLLLFFTSCINKTNESTFLDFDVKKAIEIKIDEKYDKIIYIDTSKSALIGQVNRVYELFDSYILYSNNKLIKYDKNNGNMLAQFSSVGKAKNEYISVWDCWKKNDTLFLYDMNSKKILKYNINGQYINTVHLNTNSKTPFQTMVPTEQNYFIGKRIFSGQEENELYLYRNDYTVEREISGLVLTSGLNLGYPFSSSKNETLYWRQLDGEIYTINDQGILSTKYIINFGNESIPSTINFKDEYEKIDFMNKAYRDNASKQYASLITNVNETDRFLFFNYVYSGHRYIGLYNKDNLMRTSYKITSKSNWKINNIFMINNDEILCIVDNDTNQTLLIVLDINYI